MVERRSELKRRYHRKKKMAKLKARLESVKSNSERETILKKIRILSPWWVEPAAAQREVQCAVALGAVHFHIAGAYVFFL